jgi:hypothetical protein
MKSYNRLGYSNYRYEAHNGKVYVVSGDERREVSTAVTSKGRDLERFEQALAKARMQRGY